MSVGCRSSELCELSDVGAGQPSFGAWELGSIAQGIHLADQIVKGTPVATITTGTIHPGRYLVVVTGNAATVGVAQDIVDAQGPSTLVDSLYLADLAPAVTAAVGRSSTSIPEGDSALGVIETDSVSAAFHAADAAVKDADVAIHSLVLADGLGGKAFVCVTGSVSDVTSSVDAGSSVAGGRLVHSVVIPQVTDEIREDLVKGSTFAGTARFETLA